MNNLRLIEKIKQLGFSEYEAKCYLALLERDSLSVGEISKLAGIPRTNAYESLERLMAKGIITTVAGQMKRYAASDPWSLRERSLQSINNIWEGEIEDLDKRRKELNEKKISAQDALGKIIEEVDLRFKRSRANGSPLEYLEIFKDPNQIHHKFIQLCSKAASEIAMFTKPPYAAPTKKLIDEQESCQLAAIKRGVRIRSIYEIPSQEAEHAIFTESIPEFVKNGEEARVIEDLPIKLAVFDQKIVIYVMEDPVLGKLSVTTIVAENSALAKSFLVLFEHYWDRARDYYVIDGRKIDLSTSGRKKKPGSPQPRSRKRRQI
jgi:HTH-type transcriptional regulator, sugar sensing transcriptional regulator